MLLCAAVRKTVDSLKTEIDDADVSSREYIFTIVLILTKRKGKKKFSALYILEKIYRSDILARICTRG